MVQSKFLNLNRITISRSSLIHNFKYLSKFNSRLKVAPVLKSNAYGHGIELVGKIFDKLNPPFLCVDSLYEAYQLYKIPVKTKILVMGYTNPNNLKVKKLPFSYSLFDLKTAQTVAKYQPEAGLHLFVDTGMSREGIQIDQLPQFLKNLKKYNIKLEGLMSHFASSEQPDHPGTIKQLENFAIARDLVLNSGFNPQFFHISNSAGLLNSKHWEKYDIGNMARVGLASYGISPLGQDKNLKPALEFTTSIAQIKTIQKGETVGYDFTFQAKNNMKIAILPVGYNDGVDRRLSNIGFVEINNKPCKILGRVSMNITVVDITDLEKIEVGDKVKVFPIESNTKMLVEGGSIPYELLVHNHPSTKRQIIK